MKKITRKLVRWCKDAWMPCLQSETLALLFSALSSRTIKFTTNCADWCKNTWTLYRNPKVLTLLFLGFSSGLPFMLLFSSISYWLSEAGIDRATIGFFYWVGLAYALKLVWAPFIDRVPLPLLSSLMGHRRSWLLLSQIGILFFIICLSQVNPVTHLWHMALFSLGLAFCGASQDIVIDAYRIESAPGKLQAALSAAYQTGFRLAMILVGAGVLAIAATAGSNTTYKRHGWSIAFLCMAACFVLGIITTFLSREPQVKKTGFIVERRTAYSLEKNHNIPRFMAKLAAWFYGAVFCPFSEFFIRYRWHALLLLLLVGTYRISDIVMGVMANPFYNDIGFSKAQIAAIIKGYGVFMTLFGAFFSGVLITRFGVMKVLFAGALLSCTSNLFFALLAYIGPSVPWLCVTISLDNFSGGIASCAFVAWLSGLTSINYTATQYALFSSVMIIFPKFLAGFSGVAVNHIGYPAFFILTSIIGLPVLILVGLASRYLAAQKTDAQKKSE